MAWTAVTVGNVCKNQAGYSYGVFKASGAISKGQACYINADNYVLKGGGNKAIFAAANDATHGDEVAVYGLGCIVNGRISGSSTPSAGDYVVGGTNGYWTKNSTVSGCAQVVDAPSTNGGEGTVIILGPWSG